MVSKAKHTRKHHQRLDDECEGEPSIIILFLKMEDNDEKGFTLKALRDKKNLLWSLLASQQVFYFEALAGVESLLYFYTFSFICPIKRFLASKKLIIY
ncbi:hypothetical protein GCM10011391_08100 [Pullulanibacillus camelliae]|uniref:Uncharacterized protein n=1 Tax=Pullulanibacillus camelliae TaxID=1707096 RepID=A0A8J2VLY4_9BACL|nr:hypothetical protein GCM10011391_08100 [Pullulanibacillus camelliae]